MLNYFKHKSEVSFITTCRTKMIQEISTFKSGLHLLANQIATAVCLHGMEVPTTWFLPTSTPPCSRGNTGKHTGGRWRQLSTTVHVCLTVGNWLRVKQATCEKCILVGELLWEHSWVYNLKLTRSGSGIFHFLVLVHGRLWVTGT